MWRDEARASRAREMAEAQINRAAPIGVTHGNLSGNQREID